MLTERISILLKPSALLNSFIPLINFIRLDKDLNTLCMRAKEWYSWHFPELARIVSDNHVYTKIVDLIGVDYERFYNFRIEIT